LSGSHVDRPRTLHRSLQAVASASACTSTTVKVKKMPFNAYIAGLLWISNVVAAIAGSMEDIKARGELVAGVKADYPPYGFRNQNGQIVGLEPDLAADLAKRLGVSLKLVAVLSSNRIEFLRDGKIDLIIATLSITEERRKEAGFIDPPYYAAGAGLLARHGVHVDEASQIEGQAICAVEGNIYLMELRSRVPEAKVLVFRDVPSAEQALIDGQCEALLSTTIYFLIKNNRNRTVSRTTTSCNSLTSIPCHGPLR
jgi:polar amino acid transport system substrate-binding protein